MIKLVVLNIIVFFCAFTGFSQNTKQITVAFYNCENFFDIKDDPEKQDNEFLPEAPMKWDETRYNNKLQKIAQVLDSTVEGAGLPAIVGLVEIENKDVLEDLVSKSQLKQKKYGVLCTTGADVRSIDVGLIYDQSIFSLINSEELNATNSALGDYKTRNVLFTTLKATNGDIIYVFVNHWPSRREGEKESEPRRIYAAQVVRNKINELQKKT
jgi:predicted extracellular nuclease